MSSAAALPAMLAVPGGGASPASATTPSAPSGGAAPVGSVQLGKAQELQRLLQLRLSELRRPVMAISRSPSEIEAEAAALSKMLTKLGSVESKLKTLQGLAATPHKLEDKMRLYSGLDAAREELLKAAKQTEPIAFVSKDALKKILDFCTVKHTASSSASISSGTGHGSARAPPATPDGLGPAPSSQIPRYSSSKASAGRRDDQPAAQVDQNPPANAPVPQAGSGSTAGPTRTLSSHLFTPAPATPASGGSTLRGTPASQLPASGAATSADLVAAAAATPTHATRHKAAAAQGAAEPEPPLPAPRRHSPMLSTAAADSTMCNLDSAVRGGQEALGMSLDCTASSAGSGLLRAGVQHHLAGGGRPAPAAALPAGAAVVPKPAAPEPHPGAATIPVTLRATQPNSSSETLTQPAVRPRMVDTLGTAASGPASARSAPRPLRLDLLQQDSAPVSVETGPGGVVARPPIPPLRKSLSTGPARPMAPAPLNSVHSATATGADHDGSSISAVAGAWRARIKAAGASPGPNPIPPLMAAAPLKPLVQPGEVKSISFQRAAASAGAESVTESSAGAQERSAIPAAALTPPVGAVDPRPQLEDPQEVATPEAQEHGADSVWGEDVGGGAGRAAALMAAPQETALSVNNPTLAPACGPPVPSPAPSPAAPLHRHRAAPGPTAGAAQAGLLVGVPARFHMPAHLMGVTAPPYRRHPGLDSQPASGSVLMVRAASPDVDDTPVRATTDDRAWLRGRRGGLLGATLRAVGFVSTVATVALATGVAICAGAAVNTGLEGLEHQNTPARTVRKPKRGGRAHSSSLGSPTLPRRQHAALEAGRG